MSLKKEIESKTWEVIEAPLESMGYEVVDIEFVSGGKRSTLRIYVDKEGGVTLDDCVSISKFVGPLLEVEAVEDMIPGSYNLEVSSPGLFRKLKKERDYTRAVGKRVKITTYSPIDGKRVLIGVLVANQPDHFIIEMDDKRIIIEKSLVANISLEPELRF